MAIYTKEFVSSIIDSIFRKQSKDFEDFIENTFKTNIAIKKLNYTPTYPILGFTYGNKVYRPTRHVGLIGSDTSLHFKLHSEFKENLREFDNLVYEKRVVTSYLKNALNIIKHEIEIVDILPMQVFKGSGYSLPSEYKVKDDSAIRYDILMFNGKYKKEYDILLKNLMLNAIME